jgi:2-hydroxy-3-keto-5-methylthiopentenyl-1-phosphate phosphatase
MNSKLKIYCDFDGTITARDTWVDTGEYFIKQKDKWREILQKFENGQIGARQCFLSECSLIEDFDIDTFNEIIDKQEVDPYFKDFVNYCKINNIPIAILSEGMDYYIERILDKHNIELPFYSNKLVISNNNKQIGLEFPYSDSDCTDCGCCKRNLLLNNTGDDEISVYIGDGLTDTCPAEYADTVFAKKSLASYCWKNNITYFEYRNFQDIKYKLEKILAGKKIKQRQTAKFKRREVYLRG